MNKKAIALILGLIIVVVLAVLAGSIMSRSINEHKLALRSLQETQSLWLAEAGVNQALWEFNHNGGTFASWGDVDLDGNPDLTIALGSVHLKNQLDPI